MLVPTTYTRVSASGVPDSRADTRPAIDPCAPARPANSASAPASGMSARRRREATFVKRILSVLWKWRGCNDKCNDKSLTAEGAETQRDTQREGPFIPEPSEGNIRSFLVFLRVSLRLRV